MRVTVGKVNRPGGAAGEVMRTGFEGLEVQWGLWMEKATMPGFMMKRLRKDLLVQ